MRHTARAGGSRRSMVDAWLPCLPCRETPFFQRWVDSTINSPKGLIVQRRAAYCLCAPGYQLWSSPCAFTHFNATSVAVIALRLLVPAPGVAGPLAGTPCASSPPALASRPPRGPVPLHFTMSIGIRGSIFIDERGFLFSFSYLLGGKLIVGRGLHLHPGAPIGK